MKIEQKEIKSYKEVYVANDGTEFDDRDECLKYEKSCVAVITANAFRCKLPTETDGELLMSDAMFGMGYDDVILVFDIKTSDDLDDVNKYINYNSNGYSLMLDKKYIEQKVAIGRYDSDSFYILGTMDEILERVRTTFEPCFEEKKDETN